MAGVAPLRLRHDTTSTIDKIELEKGNSEKPLPPQHPAPADTTNDPVTSPPTVKLVTVKP
jgi:hypothetical protein